MTRRRKKNIYFISYIVIAVMSMIFITGASMAANPDRVRALILKETERTAVPASMAMSVARIESQFNDRKEGATRGRGVMQILPRTAERYDVDPDDLWNARTNIRLGVKILGDLYRRFDHKWDVVLAHYGSDNVFSTQPKPRFRDNIHAYVGQVLKWERRYAENIAAQDSVEQRKREVLLAGRLNENTPQHIRRCGHSDNTRQSARDCFEDISNLRNAQNDQKAVPSTRIAQLRRGTELDDDLVSNIRRRLQIARRTLDDFGGSYLSARRLRAQRN